MGNGKSLTAKTGGGLFRKQRWYGDTFADGRVIYFTPDDFQQVSQDLADELWSELDASQFEAVYDSVDKDTWSVFVDYVKANGTDYIDDYTYFENFYKGLTKDGKDEFWNEVAGDVESIILKRYD